MLRLGQMPILTLLFFGVGLGGGLAWKTGCIPVELGAARTGQLDDDPAQRRVKAENAAFSAVASSAIASTDTTPDDPAIFEQQTEPVDDGEPLPSARANTKAASTNPVIDEQPTSIDLTAVEEARNRVASNQPPRRLITRFST